MQRRILAAMMCASVVLVASSCSDTKERPSYLFVWAGDSAGTESDVLAVFDADTSSATYGSLIASLPTGSSGTHPHHTEAQMPANGHLLANGFHAGQTWLFDLTTPRAPAIIATFGDVAGLSHPHTYVRLDNGNVLATFQYAATDRADGAAAMVGAKAMEMASATGGLVEMDERGTVIRSASASDSATTGPYIYPYSVLPLPAIDRAVSTTTDMDPTDTLATSEWVQFWRLSDLTLLKSIALPPGPRGDENRYSGEARALPGGDAALIHTFNCGVYLVREIASANPTATFVHAFPGADCGVPVLTGHYWLQTVPSTHAVVVMDVSDPEHPREVSSVTLGEDEKPHWLAIDASGKRLVVNSAGNGTGNRLFVLQFDPASGALTVDARFKSADGKEGVSMGRMVPHGTLFSR